jgi:hypothetical protein
MAKLTILKEQLRVAFVNVFGHKAPAVEVKEDEHGDNYIEVDNYQIIVSDNHPMYTVLYCTYHRGSFNPITGQGTSPEVDEREVIAVDNLQEVIEALIDDFITVKEQEEEMIKQMSMYRNEYEESGD